MVLADSHGISRVPWYLGACQESSYFRVQDYHLLRSHFPEGSASMKICNSLAPSALEPVRSHYPINASRACCATSTGLGYSPFARRYSGNRFYFLFLRVLRCFSSPRSPPKAYVFSQGLTGFQPAGFPHSDTFGSKLVCSSPKLIAAYHVLHRRLAPRHPPWTLSSFKKLSKIPLRLPDMQLSKI